MMMTDADLVKSDWWLPYRSDETHAVSKKLKGIRETRGYTVRAVADVMGLSHYYLTNLEGGKRPWNWLLYRQFLASLDELDRLQAAGELSPLATWNANETPLEHQRRTAAYARQVKEERRQARMMALRDLAKEIEDAEAIVAG